MTKGVTTEEIQRLADDPFMPEWALPVLKRILAERQHRAPVTDEMAQAAKSAYVVEYERTDGDPSGIASWRAIVEAAIKAAKP